MTASEVATDRISEALDRWHRLEREGDPDGLDELLAEEVVFHSPVVHTPQAGKALTRLYLTAAFRVLKNEHFRYVGQWRNDDSAVLEFHTTVDGIEIDGVDMITWDEQGRIIEFKVMVRPLKAISLLHGMMREMLAGMQKAAKSGG